MADTIDIKIINDLKEGAGRMQESINSSSLSREAKDINTAKIKEALNILEKGVDMTAQDLNRVSGILRSITQTLVKAYAGTERVIDGLAELQNKLQKAIEAREKARDTQRDLRRHKIKVDDNTGEVGIRKAEVGRMLKENPVKNSRGENYTSVDAVMKAAEAGNKAAQEFMELVRKRLEELKTEYISAKSAESTADEEVKNTTKEIDKLKGDNPEDSVAVQMQEFGNELQNLIDKIKSMTSDSDGSGDSSDGGEDDSALSADDIDKVTKSQDKQNSSLGKAFKQFTLYAIALRTVKKALGEAVTTVKELDRFLTEQAMVTGKTRKETYALLKTYQQMAGQLGATTKEVAEVATQFMRQGKSTNDALTLTTAAISAAKVAGISAAESVDYLTTALNGFQLSAENAMAVSDKFAAIAAQSATSYEEIATALSKVAAQANLAGMSIDYTTALLAKGIETTREAPETIGTALKTVIARMRELGDYGETLGGDTDINNVESQLAYVGIALRDANGELRSTEEVLDELGHKWDDLNSNQQAAIAKALAGTRQQSRLIAMMNDYERVVELQEIAQRSQGATLAQMSTYLEGMDAALNNVSIAWEKIVTTITNSQAIIDLLNTASTVLEAIAQLFENDVFLITSLVTLGTVLIAHLITKYEIQKANNRAILEEKKAKLEAYQATLKQKLEEAKKHTQLLINNKENNKGLIIELKKLKNQAKSRKDVAAVAKYEAEIALAEKDQLNYDNAIRASKAEEKALSNELKANNIEIWQTDLQISQNAAGLTSIVTSLLAPIGAIVGLVGTIFSIMTAINTAKAASIALEKKDQKEKVKTTLIEKIKAAWSMASSAGAIPYIGWGIAIAILAAIGIGLAVNAAQNANVGNQAEGAAKKVNALSSKIYKLTQQADALDTVVKKFDEIDNKVLKTNKDLAEMDELLDGAGDKLDSEEVDDKDDKGYGAGVSQKEYYDALQSNKARRDFLEQEAKKDREKANQYRAEQLRIINSLGSGARNALLTGKSAEAIKAQDAIYAINNNSVYEYIDSLDTENQTVEKLTQSLLEELDAYEALEYANNPQKIHALIDSLAELKTTVDDNNKSLSRQVYLSDVLTSDDYSIKDKTEAWREARIALQGDSEALEAFNKVYNEYAVFDTMGDDILELIDGLGISVDKINELAKSYKKLNEVGIDVGENYWQDVLQTYAETGRDMTATIEIVFGTYLAALGEGTEEYIKAYNSIVKIMENLLADSVLNIGQNMDKLKNSVSSIYEKANKWGSMSETDRTEFLLDNAALFSGTSGDELLRAFETGNYAAIEAALRSNQGLSEQLQRELETIEERLKIEENRKGDEYNAALVKYLREQKQLLQDGTKIFQASLEDRLALENKQLDIYKDYLKKQQDALEDSLNKRKDAYQKYFDAINEEKEDEDYEEEANTLIGNLSKLSASDDASSKAQAKELEKKLEDLEKERLETLRERAQEQVLNNIEEEISQITERFDKLLETDSEILKALQGSIDGDANFLTNMLVDGLQGKTLLEAEDYLTNTFKPAFGSVSDLSNIEVQQNNNGDLILNVAGRQINLSQSDSDDLSALIYAALSRLGITTI